MTAYPNCDSLKDSDSPRIMIDTAESIDGQNFVYEMEGINLVSLMKEIIFRLEKLERTVSHLEWQ